MIHAPVTESHRLPPFQPDGHIKATLVGESMGQRYYACALAAACMLGAGLTMINAVAGSRPGVIRFVGPIRRPVLAGGC